MLNFLFVFSSFFACLELKTRWMYYFALVLACLYGRCMYFPLDFNLYRHLLPKISCVLVSYTYYVLEIIKKIYILPYRCRTRTLLFEFLPCPVPVLVLVLHRLFLLVRIMHHTCFIFYYFVFYVCAMVHVQANRNY